MKYLPNNTLAHFNAAPQFRRLDLSNISVQKFGARTKEYRKTCDTVSPDEGALMFYTLNHCAALVKKSFTPNEPLPLWAQTVVQTYLDTTAEQGMRMLHYILSICTREMRWLDNKAGMTAAKWKLLEKENGSAIKAFFKDLSGYAEDGAVSQYMEHAPDVPVGQYLQALSMGFHKMAWGGGDGSTTGYGGPKWGLVADAAFDMLTGKTSMEMLVDTGYTLAHNGGPIFNKGMMYYGYGNEFLTILDVQRSGQMPELILDPTAYPGVHKPVLAKTMVQLVKTAMPEEFRGWVDWVGVEPSKGHHDYSMYLAKQKQAHPVAAKATKAQAKMVGGMKVTVTGEWVVMPGLSVPVFTRKVA